MRGETADEIGHGLARLGLQGVTPVGPGDVAVCCVDLPGDLWVIFPIFTCRRGVLESVLYDEGKPCPWQEVSRLDTVFCIPAKLFDAGQLRSLWWTEHAGADAARKALAATLVKP